MAVLGLAASSQAALLAEIAGLGTNLLTVTNGQTFSGAAAELPAAAPGMIARLPGVTAVQDTGTVNGVNVYKSPLIPRSRPTPSASTPPPWACPRAAGTSLAQGQFLNAATAREPVAVLGAAAAQLLGIDRIRPGMRILGRRPVVLRHRHPQPSHLRPRDRLRGPGRLPRRREVPALRRPPVADLRPHRQHPGRHHQRGQPARRAGQPGKPQPGHVSQPSDALTAQADAKGALDTLFLGLGAVALLVGAIGVANIMVISVLERRSEIGLRRALGATRGQIRTQFLAEAILLSLAGGAAGVVIGAAATAIYAHGHRETLVIPPEAWAGGLAAAVVIGALAGLLPAIRAARLSPTQALWSI